MAGITLTVGELTVLAEVVPRYCKGGTFDVYEECMKKTYKENRYSGVFQNRELLEHTRDRMLEHGLLAEKDGKYELTDFAIDAWSIMQRPLSKVISHA